MHPGLRFWRGLPNYRPSDNSTHTWLRILPHREDSHFDRTYTQLSSHPRTYWLHQSLKYRRNWKNGGCLWSTIPRQIRRVNEEGTTTSFGSAPCVIEFYLLAFVPGGRAPGPRDQNGTDRILGTKYLGPQMSLILQVYCIHPGLHRQNEFHRVCTNVHIHMTNIGICLSIYYRFSTFFHDQPTPRPSTNSLTPWDWLPFIIH